MPNPLIILPRFLHSQLLVTPTHPTTDCTGKTYIVTGGNTGLGKECARHFVQLNAAKVIITSRSPEKGNAAKADIERTTGRKGVVEVWGLDLLDYDDVKAFAKRAEGLERIDAVVENAGMLTQDFQLVAGNERTITVNVVSTFLLALLLLPKLRESGRRHNMTPTLTIVSSEVHFFTAFPERKAPSVFGTLNNEKEARMGDRYNASKLLEVLACRQICQEHPTGDMGVALNFVNPGWCYSELEREVTSPVLRTIIRVISALLKRTTESGSRCLVDAALSGPETHGKYMSDCRISSCAPLVEGNEGPVLQQRVWEELSEQLERIQPGCTKNLSGK